MNSPSFEAAASDLANPSFPNAVTIDAQWATPSLLSQLKSKFGRLQLAMRAGRRFHDPREGQAYRRQIEMSRARAPFRNYC